MHVLVHSPGSGSGSGRAPPLLLLPCCSDQPFGGIPSSCFGMKWKEKNDQIKCIMDGDRSCHSPKFKETPKTTAQKEKFRCFNQLNQIMCECLPFSEI